MVTLASGASIKLMIKEDGEFDADPLAWATGWAEPGDGEYGYTAAVDFNTVPLNDLLNHDGMEGNDLRWVDTMLEVSFSEGGGAWLSTDTLVARIFNDVVKGTEGAPTEMPEPEEWLNGAYATGTWTVQDVDGDWSVSVGVDRTISNTGADYASANEKADAIAAAINAQDTEGDAFEPFSAEVAGAVVTIRANDTGSTWSIGLASGDETNVIPSGMTGGADRNLTNAGVNASIADDPAASRAAMRAQSSEIGFLEDFAEYANGSTVVAGVTVPKIGGGAWEIGDGGATPADAICDGETLHADTESLLYLGNYADGDGVEFSISYELELRASSDPDATGQFGLPAIAFNSTALVDTPSIYPEGSVHIVFSKNGNIAPSIYSNSGSENLVQLDSNGNVNWTDGWSLLRDVKIVISVRCRADELQVSMLGRVWRWRRASGDFSGKFGKRTYFYVEPGGELSDGSSRNPNISHLHRIWANASRLDDEVAFPESLRGLALSAGPRTFQQRFLIKGGEEWAHGAPLTPSVATVGDVYTEGHLLARYALAKPGAAATLNIGEMVEPVASGAAAAGESLASAYTPVMVSGEVHEVEFFGFFAENGNNKGLEVTYLGVTILDTGTITQNGGPFRLRVTRLAHDAYSSKLGHIFAELVTDSGTTQAYINVETLASSVFTVKASGVDAADVVVVGCKSIWSRQP